MQRAYHLLSRGSKSLSHRGFGFVGDYVGDYNTGDSIAVVRRIMLEVLEIAPQGPPQIEAILAKAEYHILLKHVE